MSEGPRHRSDAHSRLLGQLAELGFQALESAVDVSELLKQRQGVLPTQSGGPRRQHRDAPPHDLQLVAALHGSPG